MKKQTAVEWLYSELSKNNNSNDSIESRIYKEMEIWKQAKAMEKEQILDAYWHGGVYWNNEETEEQWYNKTYGGDK